MSKRRSALTSPKLNDAHRWQGLRIGLLGGSFNPAHAGHMHIARLALAKFGLDFIWWIVTPQNPLKDCRDIAPYAQRFSQVEDITSSHPRMMATHLEDMLGTKYTYETVISLKKRFPKTEFLWICGMDNAHIFHRWDRWRELTHEIPVAFIARPPAGSLVKGTKLRMFSQSLSYEGKGRKTTLQAPKIIMLKGTKMLDISSTKIRNNLIKSDK